jgi:septal ring factor EnvC (AmiA/AmiB activator)
MTIDSTQLWTRTKDVLTVLVIPALIWVFSVSSTLEEQNGQLRELAGDIKEYKTTVGRLEDSERQFSVQLARLETRLDNITRTTHEIRTLFDRLSNSNSQ